MVSVTARLFNPLPKSQSPHHPPRAKFPTRGHPSQEFRRICGKSRHEMWWDGVNKRVIASCFLVIWERFGAYVCGIAARPQRASPRAQLGRARLAASSIPGLTPLKYPTPWLKKGASAEVLAFPISPAKTRSWLCPSSSDWTLGDVALLCSR